MARVSWRRAYIKTHNYTWPGSCIIRTLPQATVFSLVALGLLLCLSAFVNTSPRQSCPKNIWRDYWYWSNQIIICFISGRNGTEDLFYFLFRVQDRELMEMSDDGMCLSMHQPWASLLVMGIKIHEGRTWYSQHRGRLWIHAGIRDVRFWFRFDSCRSIQTLISYGIATQATYLANNTPICRF